MRSMEQMQDAYAKAVREQAWQPVVENATDILKEDPSQVSVWENRGLGLQRLGFPFDAVMNYERALSIRETAISRCNIGACYFEMGKCFEAIENYNRALELDDGMYLVHMNLGHVYKHLGHPDAAIGEYRQAVKIGPDHADSHMALGMLLLKNKQFEEGWKEYEWRWKTDQLPARKLKCPQWNGEDLTDKTILVYGEQGLGDIIQFGRYANTLKDHFPDASIVLEGRHPTKRLLETMNFKVINIGEKLPPIDYAIPMITLAGMFTRSVEDIPLSPYFVDPDYVDAWKLKTSAMPKGFRIGICWAGMSRVAHPWAKAVDDLRSTPLSIYAPLAQIPGVVWLSLQQGPPAEQLKTMLPKGMVLGDFTDEMYDFYETCCAASTCDLVITVDTAVAHATAGIGIPTWLLSRWDGCWRWFGDGADNPWYPSMRQFVQPKQHDWDSVIQEVAKELRNRLDSSQVVSSALSSDLSLNGVL